MTDAAGAATEGIGEHCEAKQTILKAAESKVVGVVSVAILMNLVLLSRARMQARVPKLFSVRGRV